MKNLLRLQGIQHRYNGKVVLDISKLEIESGAIVGLSGPNGSGKTTLLKIMALAEKSTAGRVSFHGKSADPYTSDERLRIALLTQESYLLHRSVYENIAYGLKIRGQKKDLTTSVLQALKLVGLPDSFATRAWHELSGGETQRVALAARLILQPDCLLLDEPTANVDMDSEERIRQAVLATRQDHGTTLVIASHQRSWLTDICDRLIYLYKGRILSCGADTIVLGPWEQVEGTMVVKKLADGQMIFALSPSHLEGSALITPQNLILRGHDSPNAQYVLQGVVTGFVYEKHSAEPYLQVVCGTHRFLAGINNRTRSLDSIRPGTEVELEYSPEKVKWVEE